jgi:hypothetical protein
MKIEIESLSGLLAFKPSSFFRERLPDAIKKNQELTQWALERAGSVAYLRQYQAASEFISSEMLGQLDQEYSAPAISAAAKSLDVSPQSLDDWNRTVEGWEQSEWFFVLFIDCVLETYAHLWPEDFV